MSQRVSGYHYAVGKDGKKHRVYANSSKKRAPRGSYKPVVKGHGGYYQSSFVRNARKIVPRGSFAAAGQALAGPAGRWAGSMMSKLAGFGAYSVKENTILNEGQSPAYMHSTSSTMCVRHREYIADIVSSGTANTFQNTAFPIQPGLGASFPWLAPIANQYEQYKIKGMVYEFKTLSADAIASAQANISIGGIIMATDYNPLNGGFSTKQQMDNTQYTTSFKPSESFYHPIECDMSQVPTKLLYIRNGPVQANADQRLYDMGVFNIASFGIAATSVVLGELWCSYEIEFYKPAANNLFGQDNLTDHFYLSTVANATPLGTTPTSAVGNSIGGSITAGNKYNFGVGAPAGKYLFYWMVGGTAAAWTAPSITATSCTILSYMSGDNVALNFAPQTGATAAIVSCAFVVQVTSQVLALGPGLTWGAGGVLPTAISSGDLWVTQIDNDVTG